MRLHKKIKMAIDLISDLPNEILEIIFLDLPPTTLLICRSVSKSWKQIVANDNIWKSKFQDQKSWKHYNEDSKTDSWYELYKERYLLESNWIFTRSEDSTIRIWDNETFQCLRILGVPDPDISIQFTIMGISELIKKLILKII